jgi:hypothetical protein
MKNSTEYEGVNNKHMHQKGFVMPHIAIVFEIVISCKWLTGAHWPNMAVKP